MYRFILFLSFLLSAYFVQAQEESLPKDQFIIKKHLQAIGGENNWSKLKTLELKYSITTEGSIVYRTIFYDARIGIRETYSAKGRDGQEKENLRLITTDTAIQSTQIKHDIVLQPIEKREAEKLKKDLDFLSPFLDFEKNQRVINYQGQEHVLGVDFHKFAVDYPSGKSEYIYINPKTYLIEKVYLNSSQYEAYQLYENHKKYGLNLVFAEQIETEKGIMQLKKIKINEDLPKGVFNVDFAGTN